MHAKFRLAQRNLSENTPFVKIAKISPALKLVILRYAVLSVYFVLTVFVNSLRTKATGCLSPMSTLSKTLPWQVSNHCRHSTDASGKVRSLLDLACRLEFLRRGGVGDCRLSI